MSRYRRAYNVNGSSGKTRTACRSRGLGAQRGGRIRRGLARRITRCPACGGDALIVTRERYTAPKLCRDGQTRMIRQVRILETACQVCYRGRLIK